MHWIATSSPFCGDVTWYLVRPKLLTTFIGVSPNYRHFPQKNTSDIENTRGICLCPLFWAVYHTYIYICIYHHEHLFPLPIFCTHGTLFTISRVSATALCVFTKCCGMSCCMRSWRTAGSKQLSCNGEKAQLFINTNIKQICAYEKRIKPICTFISMGRLLSSIKIRAIKWYSPHVKKKACQYPVPTLLVKACYIYIYIRLLGIFDTLKMYLDAQRPGVAVDS